MVAGLTEKIENPCQILQDWHRNMIGAVQKNNHRIAMHLAVPVIIWLLLPDHVFVPILKNLTSPIFSNIAIFGPSTASTGTNSSCGPLSVDIKSTALSRRTRMTGQKNSHQQTL
jgi:hypothetical protein